MAPGGGITTMTIDNTAQPGTQLSVAYEQLPEVGTGPLVQGPAGSMYGLSSTDIVQFTAGGQETMVIDDGKDDPFQLVGNGTGLLEALAACDVNNAQGEQSELRINKVNAHPEADELTELFGRISLQDHFTGRLGLVETWLVAITVRRPGR
jgi:hypothetical protein